MSPVPKAQWLTPRLRADVEYRRKTSSGLLRHPRRPPPLKTHMRMRDQPIDVPPNDFVTGASSVLELFAFEQLDLAPIGAQHAISLKLGRGLRYD
jgi:hypothetical protein